MASTSFQVVPLRDRCNFGRSSWLISQALSVTYVPREHRLYLERSCRPQKIRPQQTAAWRGACLFESSPFLVETLRGS